ncbi:hypothetical protein I4641_05040 [Waterburya agarophytonicola K14]|uniref:Uncharacterized protein n=1 Tax=Waterburya agarophytonicola KI4 TaxID=2874699 RepID=A0A964BQL9_9CYAN|nr:hypothetical protein [Waterburya agarophytonicola]MCC0176341.1 hypothetical protein [Waterburya agarophytonicola KI4]
MGKDICEGFVVRKMEQFRYNDFALNMPKWVRPHHVKTDEHWMYREVVLNQLLANSED